MRSQSRDHITARVVILLLALTIILSGYSTSLSSNLPVPEQQPVIEVLNPRGLQELPAADAMRIHLTNGFPNDPYFRDGLQWNLSAARFIEAAEFLSSHPLVGDVGIAFIDTGVRLDHPDLPIAEAIDFTGGNNPSDQDGHGTGVQGVATATANNGIFMAGAAMSPSVKGYSLKVKKDGLPAGAPLDSASIDRAVDWLVANSQSKNIKVVNMSFGSTDQATRNYYANMVKRLNAAGMLVVTAVAHDGVDINSPGNATYPASLCGQFAEDGAPYAVVACTALDQGNNLVQDASINYFVNYGWQVVGGPGFQVPTLWLDNRFVSGTGPSLVAPQVSVVAALLFQQHPAWGPTQVMDQIMGTVATVADPRILGKLDAYHALATSVEPEISTVTVDPVGGAKKIRITIQGKYFGLAPTVLINDKDVTPYIDYTSTSVNTLIIGRAKAKKLGKLHFDGTDVLEVKHSTGAIASFRF